MTMQLAYILASENALQRIRDGFQRDKPNGQRYQALFTDPICEPDFLLLSKGSISFGL